MLSELTTSMAAPVISGALSQPAAFVDLAGKLAPMASLVLYLAPLPTIQKVVREQEVGDLPLLPYSSMAVSGFLWTTYGLLKSQFSVWSSNGTGMLLAMFYALQFSRFAPSDSTTLPGSLKQHRNGALMIAISALLAALTHSTKLVGFMCVGICLALFGSPLAALKTVLTSKSAASIPLPLSLATTINCFLWSVVGIFDMKDMNVIIPNSIGFILGLVQLCLKFMYGNGKVVPQPAAAVAAPGGLVFEQNELLEQDYAYLGQFPVHAQDGQYVEPQQQRNQQPPVAFRPRVSVN